MTTIRQILNDSSQGLSEVSGTPRLDAEILLTHLLCQPRSFLITHGEADLDEAVLQAFKALCDRRLQGEPIAYITGRQGFWSIDLEVTRDVLIPRPDTETLIEAALQILPQDRRISICDLGTGSGAIALTLAKERPASQVTATDISAEALQVARGNAERLQISNLELHRGDWFEAISHQTFDMIVSNPPYVAPGDAHLDAPEMGYEPAQALVAQNNGLSCLALIIRHAGAYLKRPGYLLLEHGADQALWVHEQMTQQGFENVHTYRDLAGHDRVTMGILAAKITMK